MSSIGKTIGAALVALVLGFGAGEMFVPSPVTATASTCEYQICYDQGGIGEDQYSCEASATDSYCYWHGFEDHTCTTKDCGELCDPEEPGCEPEPDF